MHSTITDFNGSSNVGLFMFANEKFALVGNEVPLEEVKKIQKTFEVPVHRITIAGTSLVGVFVAGNDDKIIIPSIIFDEEKKQLDDLGIKYDVLDSKLTCFGNNMVVSKNIVLVSEEYSIEQAKKIGQIFDLDVKQINIAGINTVGALIVLNNIKSKGLVSNEITEEELDNLASILDYELTPNTVNMGGLQIGSGVVCNSKGFLMGKASGYPEIQNTEEGLGFLE